MSKCPAPEKLARYEDEYLSCGDSLEEAWYKAREKAKDSCRCARFCV